jgi:hypothetical protein
MSDNLSESDLGARFVVTYYRLICRGPTHLYRLYDSGAKITRMVSDQVLQIPADPTSQISPFPRDQHIVKIIAFTSNSIGDSLIVSVHGTLTHANTDAHFSQEFVLVNHLHRYILISDTYYLFESPQIPPKRVILPHQRAGSQDPSTPRLQNGAPVSATRERAAPGTK